MTENDLLAVLLDEPERQPLPRTVASEVQGEQTNEVRSNGAAQHR